eukprot:3520783-Alexandrium_andersonii.AAC.1
MRAVGAPSPAPRPAPPPAEAPPPPADSSRQWLPLRPWLAEGLADLPHPPLERPPSEPAALAA